MPVVTIQSFASENPGQLISEIQKQGAEALGSTEDNIWVILQPVTAGWKSPITTVQLNEGRTRGQKEAFAEVLSKTIGRAFLIPPEKIWILFQEVKPKNIWLGGFGK